MKIEDAKQKICPHLLDGGRIMMCLADACMAWEDRYKTDPEWKPTYGGRLPMIPPPMVRVPDEGTCGKK